MRGELLIRYAPPPGPIRRRTGDAPRHPSFKSLRFRREDVLAINQMQVDYTADLEWKVGGKRESS